MLTYVHPTVINTLNEERKNERVKGWKEKGVAEIGGFVVRVNGKILEINKVTPYVTK